VPVTGRKYSISFHPVRSAKEIKIVSTQSTEESHKHSIVKIKKTQKYSTQNSQYLFPLISHKIKKHTYKAKTKEVENEGRKKSVEKRTTAKTPH